VPVTATTGKPHRSAGPGQTGGLTALQIPASSNQSMTLIGRKGTGKNPLPGQSASRTKFSCGGQGPMTSRSSPTRAGSVFIARATFALCDRQLSLSTNNQARQGGNGRVTSPNGRGWRGQPVCRGLPPGGPAWPLRATTAKTFLLRIGTKLSVSDQPPDAGAGNHTGAEKTGRRLDYAAAVGFEPFSRMAPSHVVACRTRRVSAVVYYLNQ